MYKILAILLLVNFTNLIAQYQVPKSILKHIESIDSNKIKEHVTFLSDDKLAGRKPGTPGYKMAVDYVIEQFKKYDLVPAGENNSFLQKVILRISKVVENKSEISVNYNNGKSKKFLQGEDLIIFPHPEKKSINLNAPLVFVGAGFDAANLNLNDYKGIDVKGKIVVIMRKSPDNVAENIKRHMTYYATYQDFAAKNGAIGILICNYAQSQAQFRIAAQSILNEGLEASINEAGERQGSSYIIGGKIQFMGRISVPALKELMDTETNNFSKIWQDLEQGKFVSMPLKSTIAGSVENSFSDIISYNVIGKIEGTHRKLKNEYIIHSGHLDHIGISKPVNGDSINNGAHDNASGIACSLEIARMYSSLKEKPKRSILFVFVTAEEMGLLGSAYFMNNTTVPKNKIVADVNTDMPTIIAPFESAAPLGAEHSSMLKTVEQATSLLNMKVEPDPDPAEGRFVRSDQYNFMKAGVPAIHIKYGYKYSNPTLKLAEKVKVFRENHYHKPSDEVNDSFVWSAGRKFAQLNFLVSYIIAQTKQRPTFLKGDFFNPL